MTDMRETSDEAARRFAQRLIKIDEIHTSVKVCKECGKEWPCPTLRISNGESDAQTRR